MPPPGVPARPIRSAPAGAGRGSNGRHLAVPSSWPPALALAALLHAAGLAAIVAGVHPPAQPPELPQLAVEMVVVPEPALPPPEAQPKAADAPPEQPLPAEAAARSDPQPQAIPPEPSAPQAEAAEVAPEPPPPIPAAAFAKPPPLQPMAPGPEPAPVQAAPAIAPVPPPAPAMPPLPIPPRRLAVRPPLRPSPERRGPARDAARDDAGREPRPASAQPPAMPARPAPSELARPAAQAAAQSAAQTAAREASLEARIRDAIQAAVHYPATARMMGLTGRARVQLDYRAGAVINPSLAQSAGMAVLDDAAMAAARTAHYPPAPPEVGQRLLRLLVWVEFRPG